MIQLEYFPPHNTFGRPLSPEILEALGMILGYPDPPQAARGRNPQPQAFELWATTSQQGRHYFQGQLELSVLAAAAGTRANRTLRIRQRQAGELPGEQQDHWIDATVTCRRDSLWSPFHWRYSSWMQAPTGNIVPETVLVEEARRERRTIVRECAGGRETEKIPGVGRLAFPWGIWQAVGHLPRKRGFSITFDCLEHLRKLKRNHRLVFQRSRVVSLGGRRIRMHQFAHWGQGILPTEYWVDDADRLLLVIDGNRAAISQLLRLERGSIRAGPKPPAPKMARRAARSNGQASERPNILFICTDQQHWQALAATGNRHLATPALDALCQRGTRFENAYCTNPICMVSRSSLFTGRMPSETGVSRQSPQTKLRSGLPNIGEWLRAKAGYDCVYAGKWHLSACHTYEIPGFRVLACGQDHRGDVSDMTVSHACEAFLRYPRKAEPFFLVASMMQPHDVCDWLRLNLRSKKVPTIPISARDLPPLPPNFSAAPEEPDYVRTYRQDKCEPNLGRWSDLEWRWYLWNYYRMVEMADAEIGRILHALAASPQADNTLVVFTSDHGEGLGEHRLDRKNFHYEAAIKVPLVWAWPGRIRENVTDRTTLASGIDLVPTLCAYAGVVPPPLTTAQNLRPALEGHASRNDRRFLPVDMSMRAVGRVVRSLRFKYAVFDGEAVEQLFDLQLDPGETRNLAGEPSYAEIRCEHRVALGEWERRLESTSDAAGRGLFGAARVPGNGHRGRQSTLADPRRSLPVKI